MLLAIDPGLNACGWALFNKGELLSCGVIRNTAKDGTPLTRALTIAAYVGGNMRASVDEIVFEWPQIYRATKSKGDPNDLLGLAALCGALAERLSVSSSGIRFVNRVRSYKPAEWAGQLPKTTRGKASLSPRAKRITDALNELERGRLIDQHDTLDAVGIGLFDLGRLKPKRVFPGATQKEGKK